MLLLRMQLLGFEPGIPMWKEFSLGFCRSGHDAKVKGIK